MSLGLDYHRKARKIEPNFVLVHVGSALLCLNFDTTGCKLSFGTGVSRA